MAYLSNCETQSEILTDDLAARTNAAKRFTLSRKVAVDIVAGLDAVLIVTAALLSAALHHRDVTFVESATSTLLAGFLAALIAIQCLRQWDYYDTRKLHNLPLISFHVGFVLAVAMLVVFGFAPRVASGAPLSVIWYIQWFFCSFAGLTAARLIFRPIMQSLTVNGSFDQTVAIYGRGALALRVRDYFLSGPVGMHFAGTYDDRQNLRAPADAETPVVGDLDDLIAAARSGAVDQIIIALPATADRRIADIARGLEPAPASVHIVTHLATDLIAPRQVHRVSALGPVGLLDVKRKPLEGWSLIIKRAEDLLLGGLLCLLAMPLALVIAIAIKLDSRGPVLFRQRRRGHNRQTFNVFKFRTMTVLEDGENVEQARRHDQRITRVGGFLRRTSLDELPQLMNVIRGEMSLVGPRPHALAHDDAWCREYERYAGRHQVKPGITGLAQIRGHRGPVIGPRSIQQRTADDLTYIENWSLGLDLMIMVRTIKAVIKGHNAI